TLWTMLLITFIPLATASSLGVWPINPRIDSPASSTLIWVKNNNKNAPIVLQARVFLWKQNNNSDQFEAQDELVISPPIIEVKPDAQQIFRVMNRKGVVNNIISEKSYRILIDEVPKEDSTEGSQLRFQMRYSLPLFVGRPEGHTNKSLPDILKLMATDLRYRIIQDPSPAIEITNKSPFHARVSNLGIYGPHLTEKKIIISKGLLGYILPNSVRRWPLDQEQLTAAIQKEAQIKFEQEHQELSVAAEQ
ncbi:MAG: fimbria/pilus periplasmic chaperone, partial [Cellvibrio sp.]